MIGILKICPRHGLEGTHGAFRWAAALYVSVVQQQTDKLWVNHLRCQLVDWR
jgi:hypothetical protein